MRRIKFNWFYLVLHIINMILTVAIMVLILIGNAETANSKEKEVEVRCDCHLEESTESTESTEATDVMDSVEVTEPSATIEPTGVTEPTEVSDNIGLGEFRLTAYCPCSECNGQWENGITSTGVTARAGRTIAVDPTVIPYGTEVIINGHTYVAEDCGGSIKGNRIDIYFNTHEEACEFGVQYAEVYIVRS